MAVSDKMQRLTARADAAVAERKAQIKQAAEHARADAEPVDASLPRRAIASYSTYAEAEGAVDQLSDQGFAVRRSAIVGRGLRSVEQVTGRMTAGRAALTGAAEGGLIGLLFALLFGIFFDGPDFAGLVLYSVVVGAALAAPLGAIAQYVYSGGRRDFVSATHIEADRYELEVEAGSADEATRLLESMTATR
jgi:hypothetical protein